MLWIALHLPQLSLESFAATLGPAQAGQALALLEGLCIAQADDVARAHGVLPGLKRTTALALWPELRLGQADARRDARALQAVAHAALAFTPAVALASGAAAADTVLLEVQASLRYFGGLARLQQRLGEALAPLGHQWQLASAPTAAGAALLARWRSDLALGVHSRDRGALRVLLDAAPLALLGPGREHWEALQGMGLRTLGDLRALPRAGLARRFGPELLAELDRARGDAPEPQAWLTLPARFASRLELFTRADTTEQLLCGARVLLARLVAWAQARRGRIAEFTLLMHHEVRRQRDAAQPAVTALDIALAEPALDGAHLQLLLAERLARLSLAAPTLELGLRCERLSEGAPPNAELFASRSSEREGLTRLVERLQARLGPGQVQRLQAVPEHRPERATRWLPADAAPPAERRAASTDPRPAPSLSRPVWLLREPQPLHERASQPLLDGRPLQLLAGPERIESGWWDDALATRDYFIARTTDDALVWIYRARLPPVAEAEAGWFLQGRFA